MRQEDSMTANNKQDRPDAGWRFDNSYARLPEAFYARLDPVPVRGPKLVVFNAELARILGLNADVLNSDEGAAIFSGNTLPKGAEPLAQAYAGHQFGSFTMLGDGRAILLGEQVTPEGERFDIQLKGSGMTPFSRRGDGRAALGPMLREYIISESLHALGVPTTRSLAVVTTGEPVYRETALKGAILTRTALSHLRVGTFEYAAARGDLDNLRALADYTIQRHFPHLAADANPYLALLSEVSDRQASLVARWMLIGFIHGVMNTDNTSLCGETIDYGPCAFMDAYDPNTVFSSIDHNGRYAYNNQPKIAEWNLYRFAETLLPLIHKDKEESIKMAKNVLEDFQKTYKDNWILGMRKKLGIFNEEKEDLDIINELLGIMESNKADYTNTFVELTLDETEKTSLFSNEEFRNWYKKYKGRLKRQNYSQKEYKKVMRKSNPSIIPRNHQVEKAIEAAVKESDYTVIKNLLEALSNTHEYLEDYEEYMAPPEPSPFPYKTYCGT